MLSQAEMQLPRWVMLTLHASSLCPEILLAAPKATTVQTEP